MMNSLGTDPDEPLVLGLGSGMGGFSMAAQAVSWNIVAGVDRCHTLPHWHYQNHSHPLITADITKEKDRGAIVHHLGGPIEIVLFSPPCQPFSSGGL